MSTNTDTTTRAGRGGNTRTGREVVENSAVLEMHVADMTRCMSRTFGGRWNDRGRRHRAPQENVDQAVPPWRRYPHPQVSTGS